MLHKGAARRDAQQCLYCFLQYLPAYRPHCQCLLVWMVHRGTHCLPLFLLLCLCVDEIKDDFDTLGPDATLQAVGNGTGEFLVLFEWLTTRNLSTLQGGIISLYADDTALQQ